MVDVVGIVALAAGKHVEPGGAAVEEVIARAAGDRIVAGVAGDAVAQIVAGAVDVVGAAQ